MTDTNGNEPQTTPGRARRIYSARGGANWYEIFSDPSKDIWVQNQTDKQISLEIEIAPGQTDGKPLPPSRDPVCLTEKWTHKQLRDSANFKLMLGKRHEGRPAMLLLTEDQVEQYFEVKAQQMGAYTPDGEPDIAAAMAKAQQTYERLTAMETEDNVNAQNLHGFAPPKSAQELMNMELANRGIQRDVDGRVTSFRPQAGELANLGGQEVMMNEVVHPRVLHICRQGSLQLPQEQRWTADQMWNELEPLWPNLDEPTLQYVESHGTYRSIIGHARRTLGQKFGGAGQGGIPDSLDLSLDLSLEGHAQVARAQRGPIQAGPPHGPGPQGPAAVPGVQYQGPTGFANAPFAGAGTGMHDPAGMVMGPDGRPLPPTQE